MMHTRVEKRLSILQSRGIVYIAVDLAVTVCGQEIPLPKTFAHYFED